MDASVMMKPRDARRSGSASRVTRRVARRFTSSWRSIFFVSRVAKFPPIPIPALLTSTSSPPKRSACAATAETHASSSERFATKLSAPISAAAAANLSGRRATSVSSYPSSRSMRASAKPIPDDPPVTSADLTSAVVVTQRPPRGRRPLACMGEGRGRISPVNRIRCRSPLSFLLGLQFLPWPWCP